MSVVHENARCIDEEAYHRTIRVRCRHTHTHNTIFALSQMYRTKERNRVPLSYRSATVPARALNRTRFQFRTPLDRLSVFPSVVSAFLASRFAACSIVLSIEISLLLLLDPHRLSSSPSVRAFSVPSRLCSASPLVVVVRVVSVLFPVARARSSRAAFL